MATTTTATATTTFPGHFTSTVTLADYLQTLTDVGLTFTVHSDGPHKYRVVIIAPTLK
jgi:hypothetical protein